MAQRKRYFGNIRQLPSGRFQARYTGPDGNTYTAQTPAGKPLTFASEGDAGTWLDLRHADIVRDAWLPEAPKPEVALKPKVTFHPYAEQWMINQDGDLEQTTKDHYRQLLRDHIYPTFGEVVVEDIKPKMVREWYAGLARGDGKKIKDRPTTRAHAYGLLRTILNTAVTDDDEGEALISVNPCRIKGAGQAKRVKQIQPATLEQLAVLVAAVPKRYQLMLLLAAWCALRFGELAELRRSDVDVDRGVLHVRRGVTRTKGQRIIKGPKSDAGKRTVNIPPHLLPVIKTHLHDHVAADRSALLFPSTGDPARHMAPSSLYRVFYPAREAAGRPDLRFHDLRHTGATLAAATGATIAELMARLGHSTPAAAMRYQHAAAERDKAIAAALSALASPKELVTS